MTSTTTNPAADLPDQETSVYLFDDWFDPIEAGVRDRVRGFIETMIRTEARHSSCTPALRTAARGKPWQRCRRRRPPARQSDAIELQPGFQGRSLAVETRPIRCLAEEAAGAVPASS